VDNIALHDRESQMIHANQKNHDGHTRLNGGGLQMTQKQKSRSKTRKDAICFGERASEAPLTPPTSPLLSYRRRADSAMERSKRNMNAKIDIGAGAANPGARSDARPFLAEAAIARFSIASFATSTEILDEIAALDAARRRGAALIVSDGDEFFGLDILSTTTAIGAARITGAQPIYSRFGPVLVIVTLRASANISRAAASGWLMAIEALAPTVASALTVALIAGARGVEFAEFTATKAPVHDANRHAALHCAAVEAVIENRIWKH